MNSATKKLQKTGSFWISLGLAILLLVQLAPPAARAAAPAARLADADPSFALSFNGSSHYADFGDVITLLGGTGWASAKTISLWLSVTGDTPPNAPPAAGELVFGTDRPRTFGVTRSVYGGVDRLWVWNADAGGVDSFGVPFTRDEWFQLTVVHDGVTLAAYKNGALAGSVLSGPTAIQGGTNGGKFYMGGSGRSDPALFFQGAMDELLLWTTALHLDDIQGWVYQQVDAQHPHISCLAGNYTMASGSGAALIDDTSGQPDGALKGGMGDANWIASGAFNGSGGVTPSPAPTATLPPPATPTLQPTIPPTATAPPTLSPTATTTHPAPTPTRTSVPTNTPAPSPTAPPPSGSVIRIDSSSVALYDRIPAAYKQAAQNIRFLFMDRSVGGNIDTGFTCLASATWASSPAHCRTDYTDASMTASKMYRTSDANIPADILFPGGDSRANIEFIYGQFTWEDEVRNFVTSFPTYADRDVVTFQHNYLHVDAGSTIDNAYFDPNYHGYNVFDLVALEAQYPDHPFIYWTTSLSRSTGTPDAQSFNDQMRSWTLANGKILLDVADIESHTPSGAACRNAQGYEVICRNYTTEAYGGHLGAVSPGKIRIVKAMWVMLARLAGWNR